MRQNAKKLGWVECFISIARGIFAWTHIFGRNFGRNLAQFRKFRFVSNATGMSLGKVGLLTQKLAHFKCGIFSTFFFEDEYFLEIPGTFSSKQNILSCNKLNKQFARWDRHSRQKFLENQTNMISLQQLDRSDRNNLPICSDISTLRRTNCKHCLFRQWLVSKSGESHVKPTNF